MLSVNTKFFKESDRAPSFRCLIGDRGNSEYASSISSIDAPPSFTDIAHENASTSSVDQNLDEVDFEQASSSTLSGNCVLACIHSHLSYYLHYIINIINHQGFTYGFLLYLKIIKYKY